MPDLLKEGDGVFQTIAAILHHQYIKPKSFSHAFLRKYMRIAPPGDPLKNRGMGVGVVTYLFIPRVPRSLHFEVGRRELTLRRDFNKTVECRGGHCAWFRRWRSFRTGACPRPDQLSRRAVRSFPVRIHVDAGKTIGELHPIWRFFGADEPNYAYMKNGRKLLGELGQLGGPQVYFRCHHLLTSGDGAFALKWGSTSAYKEDAQGHAVYDWTINDRIFDSYLERGVKPYVQIGFMPEALSTHPQNYPHHPPVNAMAPADAGQAYPPKDYAKWGELAYQWAKHCVEKYGAVRGGKMVLGSLERAEYHLLAWHP